MIAIFSSENENSTNEVLRWLICAKAAFIRINSDSQVKTNKIRIATCESHLYINSKKIEKIWFRRYPALSQTTPIVINNVQKFCNQEAVAFNASVFGFYSKDNYILGTNHSAESNDLSKFRVLQIAKSVGLNIPDAEICNDFGDIRKFIRKNKSVVIKPIDNGMFFHFNRKSFGIYTTQLDENDLNTNEGLCFPAYIQQRVEKWIELRAIIIEDSIFCAAIFSQQNEKTKLDFRDYDDEKPNKVVPFSLPKKIEFLLFDLFTKLNLNTGSIDLILTPNLMYVFLEINPVGQFGNFSSICNFQIEKCIAKKLSYER